MKHIIIGLSLICFCLVLPACGEDSTGSTQAEDTLEECLDGLDNDSNGYADCDDAACHPFCGDASVEDDDTDDTSEDDESDTEDDNVDKDVDPREEDSSDDEDTEESETEDTEESETEDTEESETEDTEESETEDTEESDTEDESEVVEDTEESEDTENTDDTEDTEDTSDTEDTEDTSDTEDTEDTSGTDDTEDTEDTGSTDEGPAEFIGDIERSSSRYALEMKKGEDEIYFECIPKAGLISAFTYNGEDILVPRSDATNDMYGSTFWISPQGEWPGTWPPPKEIDPFPSGDSGGEYDVEVDEANLTITLTSNEDPDFDLQVVKKFTADLEKFAINLEYTIVNVGSGGVSWAPWEISRIYDGGLTFFRFNGNVEEERGNMSWDEQDGLVWFEHNGSNSPSGDHKIYADGEGGWLAATNDDWVFVKTFPDIGGNDSAPGHGEIEIYTLDTTYQEMEQQGAYENISAGGELVWNVTWYARAVPDDATQEVGDQVLVDFVEALISE